MKLKDFEGSTFMVLRVDVSAMIVQDVTTGFSGIGSGNLYLLEAARTANFDLNELQVSLLKPEVLTPGK